MKRAMKLKTRLLIFVAAIFLVMESVSLLSSYLEVNRHVKEVKVEISKEIREYNAKQVADYRAFITIALAEVELRLNTLFHKITDYDWLRKRYEPNIFNFVTNQWSNSVILIASNQWLDFVQTTVREKLTSLIMMRPPFLHTMYTLPLDDKITLVVGVHGEDEVEIYIGVPYWSSEMGAKIEEGLHDILFSLDTSRNNWLLFTPSQILNMNPEEIYARDTQAPSQPKATKRDVSARETFQKLIDATLGSLFDVRNHLIEHPEVLEKLRDQAWIKKNILDRFHPQNDTFTRGIDTCESHICEKLKDSVRTMPWANLHDWRERDDQNRLIWELGTITGTGIWYYDPLARFAPKGIASFQNKVEGGFDQGPTKNVGYGVFAADVFKDKRLEINPGCKPKTIPGKTTTCITNTFELIRSPMDQRAVFLVNTLLYDDAKNVKEDPSYGTLSCGVNISPILEKLALISPDSVLILTKNGGPMLYNTQGLPIQINKDNVDTLMGLAGKDEGIVTDSDKRQYYYLHIATITEDDGYVFIIQDKDALFRRINEVEQESKHLLIVIATQLVIIGGIIFACVLLLINFFMQRMVKPITSLADAAKQVGHGDLEAVTIDEQDKKRRDEVGTLVNAFQEMIEHMKEGNQVRAVLHKVVNKEVADKILKEGVELGGEVRQVAILFSDIRDFTHISESMQPQDVLAMLNDCLTVLSGVIDDYRGVIDKYVGDEIMALFGAPVEQENAALQSIRCGIAMMRVLTEWNRHRVTCGYCELKIGIGIHTGEVIAGNMGAENHLNYTILGHNVNLASRLCDHAGEMEILITEETLHAPGVKEEIQVESLPEATFKGISQPVKLFRVKY